MEGRVAGNGEASIGASCARRLAQAGSAVLVTDVDQTLGEQVVSQITEAGGRARFALHDVTHEAQWESVVAQCREAFGGLNVLVNNAGIAIMCSVFEMSLEDWQRQQAINLDGVFLGVKHCVPVMKNMADGGSVINISSVAGLQGAVGLSAYNATKGGVRLFTKGVALECGRNKWPVRVNSAASRHYRHPNLGQDRSNDDSRRLQSLGSAGNVSNVCTNWSSRPTSGHCERCAFSWPAMNRAI